MKKQAITLIGVLSLLLVAGSAYAQTLYVRGKIPFDFIVGKTTLPSGAYEIRSLNDGPDKMSRWNSVLLRRTEFTQY